MLTLGALLADRTERFGDRPCAIFPDTTISFAELHRRAAAAARGLVGAGLMVGEHVAILMPNCLHVLVAHYAVQLAGGVSVLLNARYKQHELLHVVRHCDAQMLITTDAIDAHVDFAAILTATFPELATARAEVALALRDAPMLRRLIRFGDKPWVAALDEAALVALGAAELPAPGDAEATAVMIYTSGTTGAPKACELSHAALQRSWSIYSRTVGLEAGETVWDPMPFFHSGGIGLMTGILAAGATVLTTPHFDPDVVAGLIEQHRAEHLYPGFHTLTVPVLASRHYDRNRWSFVRTVVNIAPLGTQRAIQRKLPAHVPVLSLFGMSEGSGLITLAAMDADEMTRLASAGRALPGVEVRIGDDGEIQFRGGGAFNGYYKDQAATASTIMPGGWVRTGDIGRIEDDGVLYFVGRSKDILRIGGETVAAPEIESFLSDHPAVKFVQVVGKPDDRLDEVPVAFIEVHDGMDCTKQDILTFCEGQIARFKVPRDVIFVKNWPMSATKVQKFKLREQLLS